MSVEQIVSMPIVNPDTGAASRSFEFAGKVDVIDDATVIDWKGISDAHRFVQEKKIGFQGECYAIACSHAGHPIQRIEYRLLTRPTIKYQVPKITWAVMAPGGKRATKGGIFDSEEDAHKLAKLRGAAVEERCKGHRDRQAYEDACLDWLCNVDFTQRVLSHAYELTMPRLVVAQRWLWNNCKRLLDCRLYDRWMPNEQACYTYGRECPSMPLCEAVAEGSDVRWVKEQYFEKCEPHPELGDHKGKLDVVTYSSLSCLALCEVKYYWRYEECLRPIRDEDAEPLWVGSAFHRGLEVLGGGADMATALAAVDEWAAANPVLGEDAAWIQDQQVARARAMVRAGSLRWGSGSVATMRSENGAR